VCTILKKILSEDLVRRRIDNNFVRTAELKTVFLLPSFVTTAIIVGAEEKYFDLRQAKFSGTVHNLSREAFQMWPLASTTSISNNESVRHRHGNLERQQLW
jgi:hypothetical protein